MIYRFGGFTFDHDTRQLILNAGEVHLSPKAFELLALLLAHRSRAVSKAELQQHLWPSTFVEETNVAGLVAEIRRALGDAASNPTFVRTVYGFGYRFVGEVTVDAVYPTARDPLNFPEHIAQGLQGWKVAELYLWSTNEANQIVDIGDTIERKVAALAHHRSQFHDFAETARWLRRRAEELGERTGYRAAEGFRRVMLAR